MTEEPRLYALFTDLHHVTFRRLLQMEASMLLNSFSSNGSNQSGPDSWQPHPALLVCLLQALHQAHGKAYTDCLLPLPGRMESCKKQTSQ